MTEQIDLSAIEQIGEQFLERLRHGERPSAEEYARQHPELADQLRSILPAMAMLEQLGPESYSGELPGEVTEPTTEKGTALESLGDYRVLRQVGRGGMGVVYEAVQESLGRHVALKVLPPEVSEKSKTKQRFLREARAAAMLHHTNIVSVFGVGEQDNICYYAMQFIRGLSLTEVIDGLQRLRQAASGRPTTDSPVGRQRVADELAQSLVRGDSFRWSAHDVTRNFQVSDAHDQYVTSDVPRNEQALADTFEKHDIQTESVTDAHLLFGSRDQHRSGRDVYWRSVARLGVQVGEALAHAHEHGVLHRDIKPANLMLDLTGHAWVTDFGLAKVDDEENLTKTGDIIGTLRYMAPEAFRGEVDQRSDVFSLGLTLYELLALRPAFDEGDRATLVRRMLSDKPPRLRILDPAIPADLDVIVHKAIEREPEDRYESAEALAADLQRFLDDEPIRARPLTPFARLARWGRRNPVFSGLTATVALLLITIAVGASVAAGYFQDLVGQREVALAKAIASGERETNLRITAEQRLDDARYNIYVSHMRLASDDWQAGQVNRMLETLEGHLPADGARDLRGWEWYYLISLTQRDLATLRPDIGPIINVKYSADRRYLAAAGAFIEVYDAVTHEQRFQIPEAKHFAWNPRNHELAVTSKDGKVSVWDADQARQNRDIGDAKGVFKSWYDTTTWSPDGSRIAIGAGLRLLIWKADGSANPKTMQIDKRLGFATCIDWSSDARYVAVGGVFPGWVQIWDVEQELSVLTEQLHGHTVTDVAWNPSGTILASASLTQEVSLWSADERKLIRTLDIIGSNPQDLCWSPDGKHLAVAGNDGSVSLWDIETGEEKGHLRGHRAQIQALDWSADGQQIATGSADRTIKLWTPFERQEYRHLIDGRYGIWSPDGERLAMVAFEPSRKVSVLDTRSLKEVASWPLANPVFGIDFSRDGTRIAVASKGGTVTVWNVTDKKKLWEAADAHIPLRGNIEARCVAWSPDVKVLATCGTDKTIKIWDGTSGQLLRTLTGHKVALGAVTWSPDGTRLASTDWQCHLKIWNTKTWAVEHELMRNPRSEHAADGHRPIAFSADSRYLAGGGAEGIVYIWEVHSGREVRQLHGHTGNVRSVMWTPDGQRLASSGEDSLVKIWDTTSGREMLSLRGHHEWANSVAWSPDGRRLLTSSTKIKLWDASSAYQHTAK